jgi:hypothetical protein
MRFTNPGKRLDVRRSQMKRFENLFFSAMDQFPPEPKARNSRG